MFVRSQYLRRNGVGRPRLFIFASGVAFLWMFVIGFYLAGPRFSTDRYGVFWPDFAGWMYPMLTGAPIILPLASSLAFIYGMGSTKLAIQAIGFAAGSGALLTCIAGFLPLWSAIFVGGVFDGTDLAEATQKDRIYRVRTVSYGDPGVHEFGLFECYPVRWSCRQMGSLIQMTEPIVKDKELVEIEFPGEHEVVVIVNGIWEMQVIDGIVRCPERQGLECR